MEQNPHFLDSPISSPNSVHGTHIRAINEQKDARRSNVYLNITGKYLVEDITTQLPNDDHTAIIPCMHRKGKTIFVFYFQ